MLAAYLIAGLPRSGSTMLASILAQNARFCVPATSGILDVLETIRANWSNIAEFRANPPDDGALARTLRGTLYGFYDVSQPVVIDRSRGWLAWLENAELMLGQKAKVLVPVRDMRNVLASMELLYRANTLTFPRSGSTQEYLDCQTVRGRVQTWLSNSHPIGLAYSRIHDAVKRGLQDRMLFVRYEDLVNDPLPVLRAVYQFIGEPIFAHDLARIVGIPENDALWGIKDLHRVGPQLAPSETNWENVLGQEFEDLGRLNELWAA